jgi:hypothetical protein
MLEQLHWCSVCALAKENWIKKSQNMLVCLCKIVLAQQFAQDAEAGKRHSKAFTPAVDWLDSLIGSGGLLVVVSHLFAVLVLVL